MAIGRLKPGVTHQQAEAAIQPMLEGTLGTVTQSIRNSAHLRVRSLLDREVGDAPRAAWFLLGAVGLLLLVACVNVTNLMLARLAARQREFAVRAALGAGKSRLARLALTESLLLSLTAGGLGLIAAWALLRVFVTMAPASIPKIAQASLDLRVLAVAFALAAISGAAIGLWPAITVLRPDALHGSRTIVSARPRIRFVLVTAQIALTVAMLGGATLLLRSLWNLVSVPLGFQSERVLTLSATLGAARHRTPEQQIEFQEELLDRAREMPGAVAATLTSAPPPFGVAMIMGVLDVEGRQADALPAAMRLRIVTPQYFETFRIPLTSGRAFSETDRHSSGPPAILSESAAHMLFPGERALGHRIRPAELDEPWHVVVGIVKDVRNAGVTAAPQPELYLVRSRSSAEAARGERGGTSFVNLAVRTAASPETAAAFLRQTATELDPQLPVTIRTVDQQVERLTERPRFVALLIAAFAGLALLLAAAGLYGVASFLVTQRARDIGVRMALGAAPGRVARQVVGEAGRWIAGGAALGLLLSWASSRVLESQLYGVTTKDSVSWVGTLAVLSAVLLFSVVRPAQRASRVDPLTALRED
jgi:predicted permease